MTKVLVTGGAGFIGSHLVDRLIKEGYKVIVIDNLSSGKKENLNPKAIFHKVDICNLEKILSLFKGVNYVFHTAALPRVQLSIDKPIETHRVNIDGTLNVLYASYKNKVRRVIYSSSSSVYGEQKSLPLKESMTPNPLSPYALQKLVGEYYCKLFSSLYDLETVSLRYFNVYGPRMDPEGPYALVIGRFLKLKKEGKPLTIYGDGKQTRDFTYIDDVVEANILAMKSKKVGKGEVINICYGKNHSINYVAKLIGDKKVYLPKRKGEPRHTLGDNSLAKKLLGWKPKISLEEGIEICKKYLL
ncbi:MAG: NAD dependent epimerase/dehydratase [Candidatus Parcubacteria bacterium]|nr:MAG: NAD dependent epimerase/dehydratase [Candidatus Parcubacteria bacterium]GIW67068.1 MAG: NAD dependent epimerase/dehydratase [Candidatus Parcubacteria bacterium]GIW67101.1 MAG: NAD dependent epimerase/dehydratase [Candidatus Parcubacteria bacterium]GIW67108.1 MAG: NAD dependent epimerase/dehydratase [Candidatus Parcubacteria bacterium]